MHNRANKNITPFFLRLTLLFCFITVCAKAQTPIPVPKAHPLYDQCGSLAKASGGESTANDDVAKAIAALKNNDAKSREQAAAALGKSCDARALDPLYDLLKHEDPMTRIAAIEALGRLGDNGSVAPMVDLIFVEKDWRVRLALVDSLISFKSSAARSAVLNGIANPNGEDISDVNDLFVRCTAVLSVNQLFAVNYSRKAILFLRFFLTSKYPTTRQMAEQTLYELKKTRNAASEFRALLKIETNPEFRRFAAEWIGKIGFDGCLDALSEAAANDADPRVKQAAAASLASLKNGK